MSLSLQLPSAGGDLFQYTLRGIPPAARPARAEGQRVKFNRIAYSAAHVVADPRAAADP